jgi:hypothetical protein
MLCVALIGCANSLTKEQSTTLDATLNVLMIGLGVASLVTGNPDGALGAFLGASAVADGTVGLVSQAVEQAQTAPTPEPPEVSAVLCFCPYQEPL